MLVLSPDASCSVCKTYKNTLYSLEHKRKKHIPSPHPEMPTSHVNYRYLSSSEKVQRLEHMKVMVRSARSRIAYLEKRIVAATEKEGVHIDTELHNDLIAIADDNQQHILNKYPEGSFQQLFWKQQLQVVKSSKGMRWHPCMIRWCIYLRHQSPRAYELLRASDCIKLPSQRILRDYTYHVTSSPGFSADIDKQLMDDSNLASLSEFEKHVCLIGDEMHIKEGLTYDKTSGELIGFINLGDINNYLKQLEQDLLNSSSTVSLASSIFMLMV